MFARVLLGDVMVCQVIAMLLFGFLCYTSWFLGGPRLLLACYYVFAMLSQVVAGVFLAGCYGIPGSC